MLRASLTGLVLAATAARAEGVRMALAPFEGPSARRAEAIVFRALEQHPEVVVFRWPQAAHADVEASCAEAKCAILIRGETLRQGGQLRLAAFSGATGELLDSFRARVSPRANANVESAISERLPGWLSAVTGRPEPDPTVVAAPQTPAIALVQAAPVVPEVAPPPPPAPELIPPAPTPSAAVVSSDSSSPVPTVEGRTDVADSVPSHRDTFLEVSAGAGTVSRWLSYTDDLFSAMNSYTLSAGAVARGTVEAYPLARFGGPLGHVGLVGDIEHSFGVNSSTVGGPALATTESLYAGGMRVRFGLGGSELGVTAKYGVESFDVGPGSDSPLLPNYDYSFVEGSADGRLAVSRTVSLLAKAGYLQVLSNSLQTSSYFPRASAGGVEAQLGPALAVSSLFELRLMADYRRFFFSMNPKPGDAHVAGGALDQYLCATLEGVARFR
jgi:hypothetical protein